MENLENNLGDKKIENNPGTQSNNTLGGEKKKRPLTSITIILIIIGLLVVIGSSWYVFTKNWGSQNLKTEQKITIEDKTIYKTFDQVLDEYGFKNANKEIYSYKDGWVETSIGYRFQNTTINANNFNIELGNINKIDPVIYIESVKNSSSQLIDTAKAPTVGNLEILNRAYNKDAYKISGTGSGKFLVGTNDKNEEIGIKYKEGFLFYFKIFNSTVLFDSKIDVAQLTRKIDEYKITGAMEYFKNLGITLFDPYEATVLKNLAGLKEDAYWTRTKLSTDNKTIFVTNDKSLYSTIDFGLTFDKISDFTIRDFETIEVEGIISDDGRVIIARSDENTKLSSDYGKSWYEITPKESTGGIFENTEYKSYLYINEKNTDNDLYFYNFYNIYIYNIKKQTWKEINSPSSGGIPENAEISSDGKKMIISYLATGDFARNIYKSTDGGLTWSKFEEMNKLKIHNFEMSSDGKVIVATTDQPDFIYISKDGGDNWTQIKKLGNMFYGYTQIVLSNDGSRIIVISQDGVVLVSNDMGDNWALQTVNIVPEINGVYDANADLSRVLIISSGKIYILSR